MTSKLERTWWFSAPINGLACLATFYVLNNAQVPRPYHFFQWVLYALCFVGFARGLSLTGWLLVVILAPSDKVRAWTK